MSEKDRIYLSFSPKDITIAQTFNQRLKGLIRKLPYQIVNRIWDRPSSLQEDLLSSRLFIALVSPHYLIDDIIDEELHLALFYEKQGQLTIQPILLEMCFYQYHPLGKFPMLPRQGKDIERQRTVGTKLWDEVFQSILSQLTS